MLGTRIINLNGTKAIAWAGIFFLFVLSNCKKEEGPDPTASIDLTKYSCTAGDGILCNVAGTAGEPGGSGNNGHSLDATLYWPVDVEQDAYGNLLIVDFNNHCVRSISSSNIISRVIGSGMLGDGTTGASNTANLNHPTFICVGPDSNLWLAAWHNWKLKKIDQSWNLTSPVGTTQGFSGDSGLASEAKLNLPSSLVFDAAGIVYISDQGNQCIRKVDISNIITTIAGSTAGFADDTGKAAKFNFPSGSNAMPGGKMDITNDGLHLLVADTKNHKIRKIEIATGAVTTIAGTGTDSYSGDGGAAINATLNMPSDVAVSPDNSIYIADTWNNVIRKIDAAGNISTVAGTGTAGYSANGTNAKSALLNQPYGVFVSADTTLYIADTGNHQVKKVKKP